MESSTNIILIAALCVLSACRGDTEPSGSLEDATGPIGSPCAPPPGGRAEVAGTAYGRTIAWVDEPAQAVFRFRDSGGPRIDIAASITVESNCTGSYSSPFLQLGFSSSVGLGTYEVGDGADTWVSAPGGDAVAGEVSLLGYDPETLALCGAFDVRFADGAGGSLAGTFQAFSFCE